MNLQIIKSIDDLEAVLPSVTRFSEAIRLKCLDCSVYELAEVRRCEIRNCPLWKFRDGRRTRKGGSDE